MRGLNSATDGGRLDSGQLLLQQSALRGLSAGYINRAAVSPDGSALACGRHAYGPRSDPTSVVQFSAATGMQTPTRSSDPSGCFLLLDVGPTSGAVSGWIDHGQLVRPTPPDGDNIFYEISVRPTEDRKVSLSFMIIFGPCRRIGNNALGRPRLHLQSGRFGA